MYFIGLDVYKKTSSYCVKDENGRVYQEGKVGLTRRTCPHHDLYDRRRFSEFRLAPIEAL
jgi:hypothetical protein